jgi:hypothetical protein
VSSDPFFPWHSSFGRTVLTDVIVPTHTDNVKIMLRSVVLYEEARRDSILLRVEVLHRHRRHPLEVTVDAKSAKRMGGSDDGFRSVADLFASAPKKPFTVGVIWGRRVFEIVCALEG